MRVWKLYSIVWSDGVGRQASECKAHRHALVCFEYNCANNKSDRSRQQMLICQSLIAGQRGQKGRQGALCCFDGDDGDGDDGDADDNDDGDVDDNIILQKWKRTFGCAGRLYLLAKPLEFRRCQGIRERVNKTDLFPGSNTSNKTSKIWRDCGDKVVFIIQSSLQSCCVMPRAVSRVVFGLVALVALAFIVVAGTRETLYIHTHTHTHLQTTSIHRHRPLNTFTYTRRHSLTHSQHTHTHTFTALEDAQITHNTRTRVCGAAVTSAETSTNCACALQIHWGGQHSLIT